MQFRNTSFRRARLFASLTLAMVAGVAGALLPSGPVAAQNFPTHAVTLKLTSPQKFLSGGQLTVLASVATGSGSVLSGTTVFKIAAGGVKIGP